METANVNKIVVGFNVDKYELDYLNGLSPKYLYELACEDVNVIIYDSVDAFFADINYNLIDIKNNFWFFV